MNGTEELAGNAIEYRLKSITTPVVLRTTLKKKKKGILRTVQMGGNQALNDIADFNQDTDRMCSYCREAVSTSDHIRWSCTRFDPVRKEVDAKLSGIPHNGLVTPQPPKG